MKNTDTQAAVPNPAGSPPIPGGYRSVLKGKQGPAAASEVYIVTTVFVRESVERSRFMENGRLLHWQMFTLQEGGRFTEVYANTTDHVSQDANTEESSAGACLSVCCRCNRILRLGHCRWEEIYVAQSSRGKKM